MFCHKCGRELPAGSQFCPACGSKVTEPTQSTPPPNTSKYASQEPQPVVKPTDRPSLTKFVDGVCPNCGSHDCEIQVQQNVTGGSSYSAGLGCLGFLLTGPFGLLCGLCGGSKATTTHQSVWICKSCGNQFPTRSTIVGHICCCGGVMGMILSFGVPLSLLFLVLTIMWDSSEDLAAILIVTAAITAVLCSLLWKAIRSLCGGQPIKEALTGEEFKNFKKICLMGLLFTPVIAIIVVPLLLLLLL